jgi:GNAT superfamily N-acetyltransferase
VKPELFGLLADVAACEERLVNCWPGHQIVLAGEWLCRFASGYSGRANSACIVHAGGMLDAASRAHIEGLYRAAGLRPSFRLSPLVSEATRRALEDAGYRPEDASIGMIGPAFDEGIPAALMLEDCPSEAWLAGSCRWQEESKRDVSALRGIVSAIRVPVRFATLHHGDEPVAYATVALDRGWAEFGAVIVNPAMRRRGFAKILISGITAWAKQAGAERMFFQVGIANEPAKELYRSLGFSDLYTAAYWRKPL